jgi:hypothetical protein
VYFAFSISHFVSSVGADAGFAAIIGLAILVLLYFAQARETSTLRDEATAANQRVGELERRLAQLGRPGVARAPAPAPAPAAAVPLVSARPATAMATAAQAAPAPSPHPMPIPAAPAGVGGPAWMTATRMIPLPEPAPGAIAAADNREVAAEKTDVADNGEVAAHGGAGQEKAPVPAPVAAQRSAAGGATPPPATAAASAVDAARTAPSAPAAASPTNGTGEHATVRPVAAPKTSPGTQQASAPPRRVQIRPGGAAPPSLSLGGNAPRTGPRRWLPVLLTLLIVGAVVVVLLVLTSVGGSSTHSTGAGRTTNAVVPGTGTAFKPSSVTVAVLNGTDVSQLAHHVAQKLSGTGYKQGAIATAAQQTHTTTIVGYLPGFKHDAVEVAAALKLPRSQVTPVDQSARAVACPPPGACNANVVVTVGSDLSSTT